MTEPTPRERRQLATRQRIIQTARQIILQVGIDGLSMRALAEATDYSPSALYKYFASKDAILEAVREEAVAVLQAHSASRAVTGATLPAQLYESALGYLDFAARYPDYYQLIFNSEAVIPRDMETLTGEDSNLAALVGFVQAGVDAGAFALPEGYSVLMLAMQCWITIHGMAMMKLSMMGGENAAFDRLCRQLIRAQINTFSTGDRLPVED